MSRIERVRLTEDLIQRYLESSKVRKFSANTKRSKARTLAALAHVLKDRFTCQLTATDIDLTLKLLAEGFGTRYNQAASRGKGRPFSGRSEMSLNVDRSNLRQFAKYLHTHNLLARTENPVEELDLADEDEAEGLDKMILTDDQVVAGFEAADNIHPRDRAIWALGIYLLQRESEIMDLRWGHTHMDAAKPYTEFYRRKQNRQHKLFLPPALISELARWKAWVEERHGPVNPEWFVIPSRPSSGVGTKMHPDYPINPEARCGQLTRPIKEILEAVGMEHTDKKGVHTLRRTGAVKLYEKTQDLKLVQNWLGHADIRTTMRYLRYSDADTALAAAAATYDPYGMAPEPVKVEVEDSNVIDMFSRKAV